MKLATVTFNTMVYPKLKLETQTPLTMEKVGWQDRQVVGDTRQVAHG